MAKKEISPIQKVLNVWAIILIIWSFYRFKLQLPEWFDELVAKPLVFVAPVYYYITRVEKKKFLSSLWFKREKLLSDIYIGVGLGIAFAASAIFAHALKTGSFSFSDTVFSTDGRSLTLILILALATGITEEILSRGFVLKRLFEDSKSIYISSLNASILFFILHIPILFTNPNLSGNLLLTFMITDVILSLAISFMFVLRKSLVLPILIHTFYNLAIILYM